MLFKNQKTIVVQITHIFHDISYYVLITVTDKSFAPQWFFDFWTAFSFIIFFQNLAFGASNNRLFEKQKKVSESNTLSKMERQRRHNGN
jgi:hypothetical protein